MTPLNDITLGEAISSIRDITFICGTLIVGWKVRGWIQPAIEFFKRADRFFTLGEQHIQKVESGMQTLLNNHLSHIQSDLGHISGREVRGSTFLKDFHDEEKGD